MKRIGLWLMMAVVILTACGTAGPNTNASTNQQTYIESEDEQNIGGASVYVDKLVDKESGCKYMLIKYGGAGNNSIIQMLDKDGKPLCKKQ